MVNHTFLLDSNHHTNGGKFITVWHQRPNGHLSGSFGWCQIIASRWAPGQRKPRSFYQDTGGTSCCCCCCCCCCCFERACSSECFTHMINDHMYIYIYVCTLHDLHTTHISYIYMHVCVSCTFSLSSKSRTTRPSPQCSLPGDLVTVDGHPAALIQVETKSMSCPAPWWNS